MCQIRALQLFNQWLPLAQTIGRAWRVPPHVNRDDLVAAAKMGLWKACLKSGGRKEGEFEAYIRIRIRGAIQDQLRTGDWLTRGSRRSIRKGLSPDVTFVSTEELLDKLSSAAADPGFDEHAERLPLALASLPARERHVIVEFYLKGRPLKEIATDLKISPPRISQLHARALNRMQAFLLGDTDKGYKKRKPGSVSRAR